MPLSDRKVKGGGGILAVVLGVGDAFSCWEESSCLLLQAAYSCGAGPLPRLLASFLLPCGQDKGDRGI